MASSTQLLKERVSSDRSLIATRDALIAKHNAAVDRLTLAAAADRTAYLGRIAAAEKVARSHEARTASILSSQTTATDELGRCRAAVGLIRDTLASERTPVVHP